MMRYSDGSMKVVGQLAVATFPNSGGLMKTGNGITLPHHQRGFQG